MRRENTDPYKHYEDIKINQTLPKPLSFGRKTKIVKIAVNERLNG